PPDSAGPLGWWRSVTLGKVWKRRLLHLDRAVHDRLGHEVAELRRARRARVDLAVGTLELGDQVVQLPGLLDVHVRRDDLDVVELAVVLHPHGMGERDRVALDRRLSELVRNLVLKPEPGTRDHHPRTRLLELVLSRET